MATATWQAGWVEVAAALGALVAIVAGCWLFARSWKRRSDERVQQCINQQAHEARELHDTLLQNFQGVLLKFHAATSLLPQRSAEARRILEAALLQADQAIAEARDAVQALGSNGSISALIDDLKRLAVELGADPADEDAPTLSIDVHGGPRDLRADTRDDIHQIVREAVRNALRHAGADHIRVDIHYGTSQFRVLVTDDGTGITPSALKAGDEVGAMALPGMQRRASLLGGRVSVRSSMGGGTQVEIVIPASSAHATPLSSRPA